MTSFKKHWHHLRMNVWDLPTNQMIVAILALIGRKLGVNEAKKEKGRDDQDLRAKQRERKEEEAQATAQDQVMTQGRINADGERKNPGPAPGAPPIRAVEALPQQVLPQLDQFIGREEEREEKSLGKID